jgi:hypothetical protein
MDATTRKRVSNNISEICNNMDSNIIDQMKKVLNDDWLSESEIIYIKEKIRFLLQSLDGDYSFENLRLVSEKCGNELLKLLSKSHLEEKIDLNIIKISDNDRKKIIYTYPVLKRIKDDCVAYRWWIARVIARKLLWIDANKYDDATTLSDVDMMAISWSNHKELMNEYNADSRGISYIKNLQKDNILEHMKNVDLKINQILVTKNNLYISDNAIQDLNNNETEFQRKWENFYGRASYVINGEEIYLSSALSRGLWALINQKIDWLFLKSHNIQKNNLDLLNYKNDFSTVILSLIRKLYESNDGDKSVALYNLWSLLKSFDKLENVEDLFDYCSIAIDKHNFDIVPKKSISDVVEDWDIEFDARWKLNKYWKIILKTLLAKWDNIDQTLLKLKENYDLSDKSVIRLSLSNKEPSEDFFIKLKEFEIEYDLI